MNKYNTYFAKFRNNRKFQFGRIRWIPVQLIDSFLPFHLFLLIFPVKNIVLFHKIFQYFSMNFMYLFQDYFILDNKKKKTKSTHVQSTVKRILIQSAHQTTDKWSKDPTMDRKGVVARVSGSFGTDPSRVVENTWTLYVQNGVVCWSL